MWPARNLNGASLIIRCVPATLVNHTANAVRLPRVSTQACLRTNGVSYLRHLQVPSIRGDGYHRHERLPVGQVPAHRRVGIVRHHRQGLTSRSRPPTAREVDIRATHLRRRVIQAAYRRRSKLIQGWNVEDLLELHRPLRSRGRCIPRAGPVRCNVTVSLHVPTSTVYQVSRRAAAPAEGQLAVGRICYSAEHRYTSALTSSSKSAARPVPLAPEGVLRVIWLSLPCPGPCTYLTLHMQRACKLIALECASPRRFAGGQLTPPLEASRRDTAAGRQPSASPPRPPPLPALPEAPATGQLGGNRRRPACGAEGSQLQRAQLPAVRAARRSPPSANLRPTLHALGDTIH